MDPHQLVGLANALEEQSRERLRTVGTRVSPHIEHQRYYSHVHRSCMGRVVYVDIAGKETGELGEPDTYIQVNGKWYSTRSIEAAVRGLEDRQLNCLSKY